MTSIFDDDQNLIVANEYSISAIERDCDWIGCKVFDYEGLNRIGHGFVLINQTNKKAAIQRLKSTVAINTDRIKEQLKGISLDDIRVKNEIEQSKAVMMLSYWLGAHVKSSKEGFSC